MASTLVVLAKQNFIIKVTPIGNISGRCCVKRPDSSVVINMHFILALGMHTSLSGIIDTILNIGIGNAH